MFSVHTAARKSDIAAITCLSPCQKAPISKCFLSTRRQSRCFQIPQVERVFFNLTLRLRDGLVWTVDLTVGIKLRFRDGLVWTVGLTVEIKLRFRDGLVWTVGLTVEIKLRFRDGLVWTVGLTVEIKLRFRDGLVWTVGLAVEKKRQSNFSGVVFLDLILATFVSTILQN